MESQILEITSDAADKKIKLDYSVLKKAVLTLRAINHPLRKEIMSLLDQLSVGYRTVFNLYVIEGYKHHEIATLLGISENTSKTQLMMAKDRMRHLLQTKHNHYKPQ